MPKKLSPGAALVAMRYAQQTPEERSAAAAHASRARWAKQKKAAKAKRASARN